MDSKITEFVKNLLELETYTKDEEEINKLIISPRNTGGLDLVIPGVYFNIM